MASKTNFFILYQVKQEDFFNTVPIFQVIKQSKVLDWEERVQIVTFFI